MTRVYIKDTELEYDTANDAVEVLMTVSRNVVALETELREHKAVLLDALNTRVKYLEGVIWQLGKVEAEALLQAPIEF